MALLNHTVVVLFEDSLLGLSKYPGRVIMTHDIMSQEVTQSFSSTKYAGILSLMCGYFLGGISLT